MFFGDSAYQVNDTIHPSELSPKSAYIGLEHIEQETLQLIGIGNAEKVTSNKRVFRKGDILFGKLRPYFRKVIFADFDGICSTDIWVIRPKENIDSKFLYYWCANWKFVNFVNSASQGTRMPRAKWEVAINHEIPNHTYEHQKIIGNILGTLDQKIELNKKNNETLEEIAKTLFKSWFIDFDPVKAKAEGRSTGLPDEISNLFPDSFEDSVSTLIPTGWKKKNFGDFVIPKRGKIITKSTVTEGPIPVVAGGLNPSYFHNEYNVEGPVVTISGSGANAGFVNLYFDNIWASDCSYISKTEGKNTFTSYLFLKTFQKRVFAAQHGAAQPHVNPNDLMRLEFIFPNQDILDKFEYLLNPLFQKIHINNQAKKNLEIMRNILLPKLISGELRI